MSCSLPAEEWPEATFGEVNKRLGELWKASSPEEKKQYEVRHVFCLNLV